MLISAKLSPMNWAVCLAKILMPGGSGEEGARGLLQYCEYRCKDWRTLKMFYNWHHPENPIK